MPKKNKQNQNQKQKQPQKQQKQQNQKQSKAKPKAKKQRKGGSSGFGAVAVTSVNEGVGFSVKPFMQDSHIMEGCDYVTDVILPASVTTSTALFSIPLNPLTISPESRLASFAALYDKFRFVSVSFHFATSVGTGTAGAFLMSWDADTDDNYTTTTGPTLNTMLTSTPANTSFSVYRNASIFVPGSKELFCQLETGADPRLVNHGRLWFCTEGGVAAGTYGRILMKWKIRFSKPNMDPDNSNIGYAATIVAPSGTYVSSTYPWGDFSNIISNTANNVSSTYNPQIVQFTSTIPGAGAASCLVFNAPGQYRVCLTVTGTAIGSGSYTPSSNVGTQITGTGTGAPAYPFATTALVGMTNGGSTAVQAWFDVLVLTVGGYVACTGAGGTHSTAVLTVIKFPPTNLPPPAPIPLEVKVAQLEAMLSTMKLGQSNLKSPPYLASPGQIDSSTTGTTTSVPSPANEPSTVSNISLTSNSSVGTLDVVVVDPPLTAAKTKTAFKANLEDWLRAKIRDLVPLDYSNAVYQRLVQSEEVPDHLANLADSELTNKIFSCFMSVR